MPENDTDDGDENRPTDWLAICGWSYGYGSNEDAAIQAALRYAGPFDPEQRDTVTVAAWELYADSWQSHSHRGPERGAEQLSFIERELDPEQADAVAHHATKANDALDRALADADVIEEVERHE